MSKIKPIVDADGNDYRVRARQPIGAEHLEAALLWTDRYHAAATREHRLGFQGGLHHLAFHARATLRVQPPYWGDGQALRRQGSVLPESVFTDIDDEFYAREYTAAQWEEERGFPRYRVTAMATGHMRITDSAPSQWGLNFERARILVANMPRVEIGSGGSTGALCTEVTVGGVGFFDVRFHARGSFNLPWERNGEARELTFVIYTDQQDT